LKKTNFAIYLNKFLIEYLPNICGCTPMTIDSYRYSFIHFLTFLKDERNILADKVEITHLTHLNIIDFLSWLETKRFNGVKTRNMRQATLNSFVRFLMYEFPEHLNEFQSILKIPVKTAPQKERAYLKTEGMTILIDQVNMNHSNGLRDYVLLTLLYTTGMRVSELIQIRVKDLSLYEPYTLLVHGKGQKIRYIPLMSKMVPYLQKYIAKKGYDRPEMLNEWLFINHMNEQFTRQGINYLVGKYAKLARECRPDLIPERFSPHNMRHTTAMELVDAGVDLIYIRDLLGHVSVKTTEIYIKADSMHKRQAIEAASNEIVPAEDAQWEDDSNLKEWLKNFNRK
jgi:site-specific recombinase XerD